VNDLEALKAEIDAGLHSDGWPVLTRRVPFAEHRRSQGAPVVRVRDPVAESKARSRQQARAHTEVFGRRTRP
jgi:hypothetical protein